MAKSIRQEVANDPVLSKRQVLGAGRLPSTIVRVGCDSCACHLPPGLLIGFCSFLGIAERNLVYLQRTLQSADEHREVLEKVLPGKPRRKGKEEEFAPEDER